MYTTGLTSPTAINAQRPAPYATAWSTAAGRRPEKRHKHGG